MLVVANDLVRGSWIKHRHGAEPRCGLFESGTDLARCAPAWWSRRDDTEPPGMSRERLAQDRLDRLTSGLGYLPGQTFGF